MRVRCIRLVATVGPQRGQPVEHADHLSVGDEFKVLAVLIDTDAPWPILLCLDSDAGALWEPAVMFETIDGRMPSNWTASLWPDGSLHLAPEAFLRPGFWDAYSEYEQTARATFERERQLMLDQS